MKEHIQVKKPYACSYCGKIFEENQNIKMHERIQKSKKPFECLYCDKTFAREDIMKKHERTQGKNLNNIHFVTKKIQI